MARAAMRELDLDKLLWMPTGAPRYRNAPVASGEDRVAMLRLAIDGEPLYEIDARELAPNATGYTVDTLESLRADLDSQLYLLLGGDQYAKFDTWHKPQEVARLARIAVFSRPGFRSRTRRRESFLFPPCRSPRATSALAPRAAKTCPAGAARGGELHRPPQALPLDGPAQEAARGARGAGGRQGARHRRLNTARMPSMFERVVIASGDSTRQVKALADRVQEKVRESGARVYGVEGEASGEWVLVDLGDVVVHIMHPTVRDFYNLEEVWAGRRCGSSLKSPTPWQGCTSSP